MDKYTESSIVYGFPYTPRAQINGRERRRRMSEYSRVWAEEVESGQGNLSEEGLLQGNTYCKCTHSATTTLILSVAEEKRYEV